MAPLNGDVADEATAIATNGIQTIANMRFSDIPTAIDIPLAGSNDETLEVDLQDLTDDPTELCSVLEAEGAAKHLWITIALAYAKQENIDAGVDVLNRGLAFFGRAVPKEKLSLLGCICWLHLLKSRQAPRLPAEGQIGVEARTKEYYLREATSAINDASRINPSFPPLILTRGVLSLLRASLITSSKAIGGAVEQERRDSLMQAFKMFVDAAKASGGRNMMAVLGQARALYLLGQYKEALHSYQDVLHKLPRMTDPDPRIGIGCCLWQLHYRERAREAWERALALVSP